MQEKQTDSREIISAACGVVINNLLLSSQVAIALGERLIKEGEELAQKLESVKQN